MMTTRRTTSTAATADLTGGLNNIRLARSAFSALAILLGPVVLAPTSALAQTSPSAPDVAGPLVVGVAPAPPFAIETEDGGWDGVAVQLWRQVAEALELDYEWRRVERDSLLAGVEGGRLDVALPTVATDSAEALVDLTHTYYTAPLGVAGSKQRSLWSIAKALFTARFWRIVLSLSLLLLVVGTVVWLLERKGNEEQFGGERSTLAGIGSGFWWAGVTMTTIGYGDKAPQTVPGRTVALLWMLVAMAITSSLTAALVSVVGAGQGGSISVPEDLRQMAVGAVPGSGGAAYLDEEGIAYREFATPEEGLRALQAGDVEAFLHGTSALRYLTSENEGLSAKIEATDERPQRYAFALAQGSDLREPINRVLLRKINQPAWTSLLKRYMPDSATPSGAGS